MFIAVYVVGGRKVLYYVQRSLAKLMPIFPTAESVH